MDEKAPATASPASSAPAVLLPELSADEVHKNILRLKGLRSRVDRKTLAWIAVIVERRMASLLGCTSPAEYVMETFDYEKSEAGVIVRMAAALNKLPRTAAAFEASELSWSQLKWISHVVKAPEHEDAWLDFAFENSVKALRHEAIDAKRNGRDRPRRKNGLGLPNILVRHGFSLTPA